MKMPELRSLAKEWGVDTKPTMKKVEIISLLEEEGITFGAVEAFRDIPKLTIEVDEIPDQEDDQNTVLVKMERHNPSFEFENYRFAQDRPFVVMKERDAEYLFDTYSGFRIASGKEVREFYG